MKFLDIFRRKKAAQKPEQPAAVQEEKVPEQPVPVAEPVPVNEPEPVAEPAPEADPAPVATVPELIQAGMSAMDEGDLETAYARFYEAAEMGSVKAMYAIGVMYLAMNFRPVKKSNMMELFAQGMPIMPWNLVEQEVPDEKTALDWFCKAAEHGSMESAAIAGSMICEGRGCRADIPRGLAYLEKAAAAGDSKARQAIALYSTPERADVPDEQYNAWLASFTAAVEAEKEERFELYQKLKSGSDAQLARLGYVIIAGQNIGHPGYGEFNYCTAESGIPLIPAAPKRGAWQTFVRIDLNAFADEDTLIAFSSDIDAEFVLDIRCRLKECGKATYRSPSFGWLGEEKEAVVFRIDRKAHLPEDLLKQVIQDFRLVEAEYVPDNVAFFTERGEKEYSAEIAAIRGDRVDVLFRYTIGGSNAVRNMCEPELISLDLDPEA